MCLSVCMLWCHVFYPIWGIFKFVGSKNSKDSPGVTFKLAHKIWQRKSLRLETNLKDKLSGWIQRRRRDDILLKYGNILSGLQTTFNCNIIFKFAEIIIHCNILLNCIFSILANHFFKSFFQQLTVKFITILCHLPGFVFSDWTCFGKYFTNRHTI